MASDQGNFDINIKSFFFWEVKITNQTFGVDIFGTEQKELILFQHMCHIVVRTIATVTNINVFSSFDDFMAVNHVAESTEFIFTMDRLNQGIRISVCCKVIKSIQMHAVDPSDRISRRAVIVSGRETWCAEISAGRTISSEKTVFIIT